MDKELNQDKEFINHLLLEQYRQAAEEYRSEDKIKWQAFAIILALNGVLVGFLNLDLSKPLSFSLSIIISAIVGIVSVYAGIRIIGRSQLYQKQRVYIAEQIQNITGMHLYFNESIENYFNRLLPKEPIRWYERGSGRKMMNGILITIGIMWLILGIIGIYFFITKSVWTYFL